MKPARKKRATQPAPKRRVTLTVHYEALADWRERLRRAVAAVAPDLVGDRRPQEEEGPRPAA
jgi:hypothetical protein